MGSWYKVRIGKYGRKLYLFVDNIINTGIMHSADTLRINGDEIYLGGLPDMSSLPFEAMSTLPIPYTGCLRKLSINNARIPLNASTIRNARNIGDCDGTPCGGEYCYNGGTCWLDTYLNPHCTCTEPYYGDQCEQLPVCNDGMCKNNGKCVDRYCSCNVGWTGAFCEHSITVKQPKFIGSSYITVNQINSDKKRQVKGELKNIFMNFSTANNDGLILFRNKVPFLIFF